MYVQPYQTSHCTYLDSGDYEVLDFNAYGRDGIIVLMTKNNVANGPILVNDIYGKCWAHCTDKRVWVVLPGDGYWEDYNGVFPPFPREKGLYDNICNIELDQNMMRAIIIEHHRNCTECHELEF